MTQPGESKAVSCLVPADDGLLGVAQQGGHDVHQVLGEIHGALLKGGVLGRATQQLQHKLAQAGQILPLQRHHIVLPSRLSCQNLCHTQASWGMSTVHQVFEVHSRGMRGGDEERLRGNSWIAYMTSKQTWC